MGGFGGTRTVEVPAKQEVSAAQQRQEQRAEAQETKEMTGAMRRRRMLRTGGMRLLFSPMRQEGPGVGGSGTKLGGG
jgi:hypothetical protein